MIALFARRKKAVALLLLFIFVTDLISPRTVLALTSGPTQPEVQGFQAAGTSEMVDLFSGDFSYNIPLFELPGPNGGYPFNLSYQSGISMDQEASWVGLGWSLNPGAINRQMRGLPDEFKGDLVYTKMSVKPNVTVGIGAGATLEVFGASKAQPAKTGGPKAKIGFTVYTNSYNGLGYSLDMSLGYQKAEGGLAGASASLSLSLDSDEGVDINPSIGLSKEFGEFGLNVPYNSKSGLQNASFYAGRTLHFVGDDDKDVTRTLTAAASLSFAQPSYTPQITMPMTSTNVTATFKAGASFMGIFGSPYVKGFYNERRPKWDKVRVPTPAFGYLNYQYVDNAAALIDFNREKEGIVSEALPNLPLPSLSFDIYSVAGQGISAMYRPMRNDYGTVWDPKAISESNGVGAGLDLSNLHGGVNVSVNHSLSVTSAWDDESNQAFPHLAFKSKQLDQTFEPWYFKAHGEMTSEDASVLKKLGGENAVRVQLAGSGNKPATNSRLETTSRIGNASPFRLDEITPESTPRKPRNQVIQPITNSELLRDGEEVIPSFKITYIDSTGKRTKYKREWERHHTAGFTALTPSGLRYVYGLPAYNLKQEEVSYSTILPPDGKRARVGKSGDTGDPDYARYDYTDKFLKSVELPEFAHSFLLTSILGPDYVDVSGDGVTSDDLGYWVKFTYRQTSGLANPYKWRDPYSGAHYLKGWETDPADDKGSFTYGQKEIWYLAKAETKSHVAEFFIETRQDGYGVDMKLQDADNKGKPVYALTKVVLYTSAGSINNPIKTVRFQYDNSLCQNVANGTNGAGKLTLRELWFEYGTSSRGALNPYKFSYHSSNPDYDITAYDRWGNYKPNPEGRPLHNTDFPYVNQDPLSRAQLDSDVASWSLTEIQLPSGGKIHVDYESDDYAYVQHKPAMQMMELVDATGETVNETVSEFDLTDDAKIRFKLEKPISKDSVTDQRAEVMKYLDKDKKSLFFKIKANLKTDSENLFEFINAYADVNYQEPMTLETGSNSNEYAYGTFYLVKENGYNPLSLRVWQHLRVNQPDIGNSGAKIKQTNNPKERAKQIRAMSGFLTDVKKMFVGYYNYCARSGWGRELLQGSAWVRLRSPDRIKHGGGLRVRQLTMVDASAPDRQSVYGQVYKYSMVEDGKTISSGVASYEPIIGGEENALRNARKYHQSLALHSDNNMFFEYPANETYYPSAQVGYRKVKVYSLPAAVLAGMPVRHIDLLDGQTAIPTGEGITFGTTGLTVHEFYTARDFPVVSEETEKKNMPFNRAFTIPLVGSIQIDKLTSSQGYVIITNDMHGKPKSVTNYRQEPSGKLEATPISWVRYNYASERRYYENEQVLRLRNQFSLNSDGTLSLVDPKDDQNPVLRKFTIGQENEMFADMRSHTDKTWTGGGSLNIDVLTFTFIVIPVPNFLPDMSRTSSELRTVAVNKVIFKSGILESVEAYDGGSVVKTNNLKWDQLTGGVVLSSANNNFDKPVFSYSIPAYTKYQGMGAAYQNVGMTLKLSGVNKDPYKAGHYSFDSFVSDAILVKGDELLLFPLTTDVPASPIARAVYVGEQDGIRVLYTEVTLSDSQYTALIVRSGYRNQLGVMAGTITGLDDPSKPGTPVTFNKTVVVPQ